MRAPVTVPSIRLAAIGLAVFMGSVVAGAAQDIVVTASGDRLVGEIQSVEKDVLTFSTPYSDSDFKVEWGDVVSIESNRQFIVETFDGKRLSGSLRPDPDKKLVVQVSGTPVPLPDVSSLQPFEQTFWKRWDAGLDFGYSMTATNSATQLSLGTNLRYRDEHYVDVVFANLLIRPVDLLDGLERRIHTNGECLEHHHERLEQDRPFALRIVGNESDVGFAVLHGINDVLRCLDADQADFNTTPASQLWARSTAGPPIALLIG